MIATLINSLAVIFGALIGVLFRKLIKKEIFDSVLKVVGVVVLIFGLVGVLKGVFYIDAGQLKTQYELLLLITLALGTFIGELLQIENRLQKFGENLERKLNKGAFSEGFITASLIFCIGAMAITGSINAGALGDPKIIYLKSMIDFFTAIVLAAALGYGVMFSSITILIYQGSITILGIVLGEFMSLEFVTVFSMVGYAIVACIGLNFLRTEKLKLANMIPSLLLVIIYFIFLSILK